MTVTAIPRECVKHARTQRQADRDELIAVIRAYRWAAAQQIPPVYAEQMLDALPAQVLSEIEGP